MKLLYLTPGVYDKGGISRYNRFQVQALRDVLGDLNVSLVSLLGPDNSARDLETDFAIDHCCDGSKARFVRAALNFALRNKPDVVWSGLMNYSVLTLGLARLIGAKAVVQVYGREVWSPRRSRQDIPWSFRRIDEVVADCHFTANYVERHFHPHRNVHVIWDCVDNQRFFPFEPSDAVLAQYGIDRSEGNFTILTLGRLSKAASYKGYERLLEVFPSLPANSRLVFGGGGDLIPYLRERAAELEVADRVVFTGFIDEADLPDIYRSASVFCLIGDRGPGRGEGIPLTPLEAAACGVPIIVGNQDGSREAVNHGVNGFALNPLDLVTISKHLIGLARDESLRRSMGAEARRKIEKDHSYEVFKDRTQRFINSIHKRIKAQR
jgi:phosphatidylinositol alpha-1,6-mannosyltransferase